MKHVLALLTACSALLAHAQPNTEWLRTAGGFSQFEQYFSATDASGHIYTAGLGSAMDFGSGITVPGEGRIIAQYDSSGTITWARALTTTLNENAVISAIATTSDGELWVTGHFLSATLTLDAFVLNNGLSNTSAFLARFDNTGAVEFASAWGGAAVSITTPTDICTGGLDEVYVTGTTNAPACTIGNVTITNTAGSDQLFALKFDASGSALWGTISSSPQPETRGHCISTDAAGNAYLVGRCTGEFILGEDTVDTGSINQSILVKLAPTGAVERMDVLAECFPLDLDVDDVGNAYVCGWIMNTAIFNSDTLVPSVLDGFVAAYDTEGSYRWVVGVEGEIDNELCWSVTLDAAQTGLVVGGTFVFDAWFGGLHVETDLSPTDGFVMFLDTTGAVGWVKDMSGDGPSLYAQACLDPWDHLYASGVTQSATTYLGQPVLNGSGNHAFLARFGAIATAVPSIVRADGLQPYPNPCHGTFAMDLPAETRTVAITDVQGRVLQQVVVPAAQRSTFHLGAPGVYFVTVFAGTGPEVHRVVVE